MEPRLAEAEHSAVSGLSLALDLTQKLVRLVGQRLDVGQVDGGQRGPGGAATNEQTALFSPVSAPPASAPGTLLHTAESTPETPSPPALFAAIAAARLPCLTGLTSGALNKVQAPQFG
uniref:Uncharacterized protein n=1 Tax=Knipowitschia caucasica TaxID=637954 RepID=A0AAV2L4Y6_KNICA